VSEPELDHEPELLQAALKRAMEATHGALATGQGNPGARLVAASVLVAGEVVAAAISVQQTRVGR
jgi:DNA-binding IclR family transcriptional regulator